MAAQPAPLELLMDSIVDFLAVLSDEDFRAIVLQARPPEDPDPADNAPRHLEAA